MFERFTDRARRVPTLAREEAGEFKHNYIGTEHLLLGIIREGEGIGAKALEALGISLEAVRQQVREIIGQGQAQQGWLGQIPFSIRAKKVLELSLREALQLGHNYIGTEHLLLGIIRKGDGVAVKALINLGADLNVLRTKTLELLGMHGTEAPGQPPTDSGTVCPFDIVLPGGVYVGLHDVPADNLKEVLLEAADRLGELAARL